MCVCRMAPYVRVQYSMALVELDRCEEAYEQVKLAKKYKNYSLENAIHIRIQNCLNSISAKSNISLSAGNMTSDEKK